MANPAPGGSPPRRTTGRRRRWRAGARRGLRLPPRFARATRRTGRRWWARTRRRTRGPWNR
eukprot:6955872-Alexandrium_andersonii.AAC.1